MLSVDELIDDNKGMFSIRELFILNEIESAIIKAYRDGQPKIIFSKDDPVQDVYADFISTFTRIFSNAGYSVTLSSSKSELGWSRRLKLATQSRVEMVERKYRDEKDEAK